METCLELVYLFSCDLERVTFPGLEIMIYDPKEIKICGSLAKETYTEQEIEQDMKSYDGQEMETFAWQEMETFAEQEMETCAERDKEICAEGQEMETYAGPHRKTFWQENRTDV